MLKHKKVISIFILLAICLISNELLAQCPMCKIAAESNMKAGGTAGRGLNAGILYMLVLPYMMVSIMAYIWWKNRKKESPTNAETVIGE